MNLTSTRLRSSAKRGDAGPIPINTSKDEAGQQLRASSGGGTSGTYERRVGAGDLGGLYASVSREFVTPNVNRNNVLNEYGMRESFS